MRALTVRQPYATLIALGGKTVENRPQYRTYRGPLAVHAGMGWMEPAEAEWPLIAAKLAALGLNPTPAGLPCGVFLAVTELVGCHAATEGGCCAPWGFGPPRFHLQLAGTRALPEPIPAVGRLGLWTPPADVVDELTRAAGQDRAASP